MQAACHVVSQLASNLSSACPVQGEPSSFSLFLSLLTCSPSCMHAVVHQSLLIVQAAAKCSQAPVQAPAEGLLQGTCLLPSPCGSTAWWQRPHGQCRVLSILTGNSQDHLEVRPGLQRVCRLRVSFAPLQG
jgi:hypothetical protein